MEPPFFRSVDNSSGMAHCYHRPDELIGFADLLLRWSYMSFYKVPFFTVLRRVGEDFGFYLHLYEADSIGLSDVLPDGVSDETTEPEYEEDGSQKAPGKNPKPRKKTAAELEADRLYIYLRFQTPLYFRSRYEDLWEKFGRLFFLRSEVEAIEKVYPECRITNLRPPPEAAPYNDRYLTTEKNIADVANFTLYRMISCPALPVQHPNSFRDGLLYPDTGDWWRTKERANNSFRISLFPTIPKNQLWPDIPVVMPDGPKKRRTNALKPIWPKVAVLKRLGMREPKKMAKIIFFLHPNLNDEEIGRVFPAKPGTKRSSETDRDRGRILLGKKKPRKPPNKRPETTT